MWRAKPALLPRKTIKLKGTSNNDDLSLDLPRGGVTLVFTVDLSRKRLRLRDLRPFLCVPGTLLPHAVAMRSSVTRRRML